MTYILVFCHKVKLLTLKVMLPVAANVASKF